MPAAAQTDFTDLSPSERAVLAEAIREALLDLPHLLPEAQARTPLEDEISTDLARIEAHADRLFDSSLPGFGNLQAVLRLALFVAPECVPCMEAEADLRALADTHDIRATLLKVADVPDLVAALEIDMTPFVIFPDKFLRGHIPRIIMERYLGD